MKFIKITSLSLLLGFITTIMTANPSYAEVLPAPIDQNYLSKIYTPVMNYSVAGLKLGMPLNTAYNILKSKGGKIRREYVSSFETDYHREYFMEVVRPDKSFTSIRIHAYKIFGSDEWIIGRISYTNNWNVHFDETRLNSIREKILKDYPDYNKEISSESIYNYKTADYKQTYNFSDRDRFGKDIERKYNKIASDRGYRATSNNNVSPIAYFNKYSYYYTSTSPAERQKAKNAFSISDADIKKYVELKRKELFLENCPSMKITLLDDEVEIIANWDIPKVLYKLKKKEAKYNKEINLMNSTQVHTDW